MPVFSLSDFLSYALDYLQTHPAVQLLLLVTGLLLAVQCAVMVEREQQRLEDARAERLRLVARAQDAYRAQIHRDIHNHRA